MNANRGFVMIAVLVTLILVAAIALLLSTESVMQVDRSSRATEALQADYVALAAAEHASWIANRGTCTSYALPNTSFGSHSYSATFSSAAGSPIDVTAAATLASGITRSLSRDGTRALQSPSAPAALQPDAAAGTDTYIYEGNDAWNHGASSDIRVEDRYANSRASGLLRFDLGIVPFGAHIHSAVLELYQTDISLAGGPVGVYRLTTPWIEGAETGGSGAGANWTEADSGIPWNSAGGDFSSSAYAIATVPPSLRAWTSWDISRLVEGWVSGKHDNNGLLLRAESDGTAAHFASSDSVTASERPKLTIEYSCECGITCTAPQGSGRILLVVDNSSNPAASDIQRKALFESWGYTVTMIQEEANTDLFNDEIPNNDLIYISATVEDQETKGVIFGAGIGIVSEKGRLNDELGFSSNAAWVVGDTLSITDNSHFITSEFPVGDLKIYDGAMEGLTVSGSVAAGASMLADWNGNGGLVAIDTGGALGGDNEGENAAARRVMLPLGRNINWSYLNNNGRLAVQRALEWANEAAEAPPSANLLFVVSSVSNPTANEDAKKTLIESWGYTVALIDDGATQASFDTAIAANDVVFVPAQVSDSAVGTKLVSAPIGVVNEKALLIDEFGIASSYAVDTATTMTVTNNTHYITEVFSTGPLPVLNSSGWLFYLTGSQSTALDLLASTPTGQGLVVLDAGDALHSGGTAAGPRVELPWGGLTQDFSLVNNNGRTIMQRALEWATNASAGGSSPGGGDVTATFQDQFNTVSYGGNDGTRNWSGNWQEIGEADGPSFGSIRVVSGPVGSVVTGPYLQLGLGSTGYGLSREADLTDATSATLSFWYEQDAGFDPGEVLLEVYDGASWNLVETYTVDTDFFIGAAAVFQSFNISTYAAADTQVRLTVSNSSGGGSFFLDDLMITATFPEGSGGGGLPSPGSCSGTFRDEFNAIDYGGSDGTLSWSSDWLEINEADGPAWGDVQIALDPLASPPQPSNQLRVRDNDGGGEGVVRTLDLTGAGTATLSMQFRRASLDDSNDYVAVQMSVNGASGPWTEITRFQGPANESGYQPFTQDVSGYIAANTALRFISSPFLGGFDDVWFDDVEIQCSP